jgi:hypothetical protein
MLHIGLTHFQAARRLFAAIPIAPLIAAAIWAYSERPSITECWLVGAIVGPATIILTFETLRWLDHLKELSTDESR